MRRLAARFSSRAAPSARPGVTAVQAVAVVLVGAFAVSTFGIRDRRFDPLLDGWLQGAAYVACAAVIVLRPALSERDRRAWAVGAAAIVARAVAFVLYIGIVRTQDPLPYPSVADACWVAMAVLLAVGLATFARSRFGSPSLNLVLDGLIGICATASLAFAVLPDLVRRLNADGATSAAVVMNALYPILDVALLLLVIGLVLAFQGEQPPALWVFAAGVSGIALVDVAFVFEVAAGTYRPAGPLATLSILSTALVAFSAWVPAQSAAAGRRAYLPGLVVPGLLALVCLIVLVRAAFTEEPAATVLFAAGGVLAAVVRTGVSFRDVRRLADSRHESRMDDLTGLFNRRAFNEALARALRGGGDARPFAVLVLDVDGFKGVNESLGHHRGDELLTLMAPRLELAVRPNDVVARVGGDEFAVLVDDCDADLAEEVAGRLREACRGPFTLASRPFDVGVSIGIALFPEDGQVSTELLQHADLALHAAKEERTGHSFFRPEHLQASQARVEGVAELRAAIEGGEIVLHYQPKVDMRDGSVFGVEALVRWQHPTQGLIYPDGFLRQAESGGLMRQLTMHVLDSALAQWARWRAGGIDTTVAVNLSVADLLDRQFPAHVASLLDAHGVPGTALVFELTEDLLLADPSRGHQVIEDLRKRDVRVQVDDYGTGFSTLGYLRDLPQLGGLKLDRSFVMHLPGDERSLAIVESTVALARSLGLDLVAEGIETAEARDVLVALGCFHGQGYFFSRPVPADAVPFGRLPAEN